MDPWGHRWLTSKAEVRESPIHGIGTFAIQPIPTGEVISVLGGVVVHRQDIQAYRARNGHVGIQIDDDFFLCPSSREELRKDSVFNHSCNPNKGWRGVNVAIALRDIQLGEEIACDYAFMESSFMPFPCNCGAAACRGTIRPTDWQLPSLQERYGPYFSLYLREKFGKA